MEDPTNWYLSARRLVSGFTPRHWSSLTVIGLVLIRAVSSVCVGSIYRVTVLDGLSSPDATCKSSSRQGVAVDPYRLVRPNTRVGALVPAAVWAFVENAIGIVSACLPTLRPIYNILVHGHHCSIRDNCSRCQTSTQKASEYMTSSGEQHLGNRRPHTALHPATQMIAKPADPLTPATTYTTPPTTHTAPNISDAASSDHVGQTFWISDTTESDPESGIRDTPSIEIW